MSDEHDEIVIAAAVAALGLGDDFIKFDDDEMCDESCRGWDGMSRRCECGNRRLYWSVVGDSAYPEAY